MDKTRIFLILLSVVFLSIVGYNKLSLPLSTVTFSPESFYRSGGDRMVISSKEYYELLNNIKSSDNTKDSCDITVINYEGYLNIGNVGNCMPIPYSDKNADFISIIGKEGEGIFKDEEKIIMPISTGSFKNSNLLTTSFNTVDGSTDNDIVNIEIIGGKNIIIIFEDVVCWWCHAHNTSNCSFHDKPIGNNYGSSINEMRKGSVLGVSKSTTKIKIYYATDTCIEKYNGIENIKDLNELEQINAGEYLVNGLVNNK